MSQDHFPADPTQSLVLHIHWSCKHQGVDDEGHTFECMKVHHDWMAREQARRRVHPLRFREEQAECPGWLHPLGISRRGPTPWQTTRPG